MPETGFCEVTGGLKEVYSRLAVRGHLGSLEVRIENFKDRPESPDASCFCCQPSELTGI